MEPQASVTLQTIQTELQAIRKEMATKDELRSIESRMATKDDLKDFATKDDLKDFATKDDLKDFATKDDLKDFATKDDLKDFATKDDLKDFATKDDLSSFATKDDLVAMEQRMESHSDKMFTAIKEDLDSLQTTTNAILSIVEGHSEDLKDHDLRLHLVEDDMIRVKDKVGIPATVGKNLI